MSLHPDPSACACNIQRERFTTLNYWQTNPSVGARQACLLHHGGGSAEGRAAASLLRNARRYTILLNYVQERLEVAAQASCMGLGSRGDWVAPLFLRGNYSLRPTHSLHHQPHHTHCRRASFPCKRRLGRIPPRLPHTAPATQPCHPRNMAAVTASVGVLALSSPRRPQPTPSGASARATRCQALSFPYQPQLSSFTTSRQGPSCPWPAAAHESANSHASQAAPSGIWAFLPSTVS